MFLCFPVLINLCLNYDINLIITQQNSLRGIQTKKKKENTVIRWGMGQRRNSAAQHNNRPTKRAGLPAWLVCSLPFAGSHTPTNSASSITMLTYSHNTG